MFCSNCGAPLEEGAAFCTNCGARAAAEFHGGQKKSKKGLIAGLISAACVLVAVIVAVSVIFVMNSSKDKAFASVKKKILSYNVSDFTEQLKDYEKRWDDCGLFGFSDKKALLKKMEALEKSASDGAAKLADIERSVNTMTAEKSNYSMAASYADYESALSQCQTFISERNYEKAAEALELAEEKKAAVIAENEAVIAEKMDVYASADMTYADPSEIAEYNESMDDIESMMAQEDYKGVQEQFDELDSFVYQYVEPQNKLSVSVQQADVSEFPKIKLYVRIEDEMTGEPVDNLDQAMFYVRKQDANADYIKQMVSKVSQLDQLEGLNINMVADVSGSMDGSPMNEAKNVMSNFIGSVQFGAGDKVELISFSTGVYIEQEFTDSADRLVNCINGLWTDNMTSLYDALYTAVLRTASQTGAKCVMAFTDGKDNYSNCSYSEVIDIALRYHVPIFIIGFGDVDGGVLNSIASQTGGVYYNVNSVSSMHDIYSQIYRQEKEMYIIEFEDQTGADVTQAAQLMVGYNSAQYGGDNLFTYTPNILLSVEGSSLYTDGPESVVEKYIRAFDSAMTNGDFSLIAPYLKVGSDIYNSQQKYVTQGISEMLENYEIVDVTYKDSSHCVVTTRETFYVQSARTPLYMMTQQCKYNVENDGSGWKMTGFAENVQVLSKINQ